VFQFGGHWAVTATAHSSVFTDGLAGLVTGHWSLSTEQGRAQQRNHDLLPLPTSIAPLPLQKQHHNNQLCYPTLHCTPASEQQPLPLPLHLPFTAPPLYPNLHTSCTMAGPNEVRRLSPSFCCPSSSFAIAPLFPDHCAPLSSRFANNFLYRSARGNFEHFHLSHL
jgi:hypothetical protein